MPPDVNEITAAILRLSWPNPSDRTTDLFKYCTQYGAHPSAFEIVIVIILPKPEKTDRALYESYGPIALLYCSGKEL